jgi:hypothetical protein
VKKDPVADDKHGGKNKSRQTQKEEGNAGGKKKSRNRQTETAGDSFAKVNPQEWKQHKEEEKEDISKKQMVRYQAG